MKLFCNHKYIEVIAGTETKSQLFDGKIQPVTIVHHKLQCIYCENDYIHWTCESNPENTYPIIEDLGGYLICLDGLFKKIRSDT